MKLDSSYDIFQKKSVPKEACLLLRKRETYVCIDCVAQVALEKENMQPFLIQLQPNVKPKWLGDAKNLPPNMTPLQQQELDEFRERESWLSNYNLLQPNSYFTAKVVLDREYVKYPRPGKYWNGFLCSKICKALPNEVDALNAQFYGPKAVREIDVSGSDQQTSNTYLQTSIPQPNQNSKGNSNSAGTRQQVPVVRTNNPSNDMNNGQPRPPSTVNIASNTNNNSSTGRTNPQAPQAKRTQPTSPPQSANSVSLSSSSSCPPAKKHAPPSTPTSKFLETPRHKETHKQKATPQTAATKEELDRLVGIIRQQGGEIKFMMEKINEQLQTTKVLRDEISRINGEYKTNYSKVIDKVNTLQHCVNSLMKRPLLHQNSTVLPENWQTELEELEKRMVNEREKTIHRMKTSFKEEIYKYTDKQLFVILSGFANNISKTDTPESQSHPLPQNSQLAPDNKWEIVFKEMNRKINETRSKVVHLEQKQLPPPPPPPPQPQPQTEVDFSEVESRMSCKLEKVLERIDYMENIQEQRYRQIMDIVAPGSNSSDSDCDSE